MTVKRVANLLASLTIAAMVAGAVAVTGGPTWAWLGFGLVTYLMVLPDRRAAKKDIGALTVTIPANDDAIRRLAQRLNERKAA